MRIKALVIIIAAIVVAAVVSVAAQDTTKAKTDAKKSEDVLYRADASVAKWGDANTAVLSGNVKFVHIDTTLTSDKILFDHKANTADSPGPVKITDPECDITGKKGSADFKKRLGVVEGDVMMLLKPKLTPEEQKARQDKDSQDVKAKLKEPTTISCPKLEYQYKKKIATATGGVSFKQEKRAASADKAIYDIKAEKVTLIGHVKAVDENGQTFETLDQVTFSLKKGDEKMEGTNVSGSFKIDMEE
ncbi:MAG: LptA/OstA family protein [Armatimonadota bacterium]